MMRPTTSPAQGLEPITTPVHALDDAQSRQQSAKELLALKPDIILTQNTPPTASMLQLAKRSHPLDFDNPPCPYRRGAQNRA
jgi:hypothetical protein